MHATLLPALAVLLIVVNPAVHASQPMHVALCNRAGLEEKVLTAAQHQVELTFNAAAASVTWVPCQNIDAAKTQLGNRLFVIRLRGDIAWFNARSVSLDAMGRAYTNQRGEGYLADAYMPSIKKFRNEHDIEFTTLLGLVISHELGHLLLGPGHSEDGIMFGRWTRNQTEAGRKRWLRFNHEQSAIILSELDKRAN